MSKCFKVIAKCGHVDRNNYIEIAFTISAEDAREAAAIAQTAPSMNKAFSSYVHPFIKELDDGFCYLSL